MLPYPRQHITQILNDKAPILADGEDHNHDGDASRQGPATFPRLAPYDLCEAIRDRANSEGQEHEKRIPARIEGETQRQHVHAPKPNWQQPECSDGQRKTEQVGVGIELHR